MCRSRVLAIEHETCPVAGLIGVFIGCSGTQHYPVSEVIGGHPGTSGVFAMI
jgi:hypothetical protein